MALNMKRGFEAVLTDLPGLAQKSLPDMLKAIGMTMVMKVGGASGPLVGTFFMELGKALPEEPSRADVVAATAKAVDGVKARGNSETGQKTLLDVLVPVQAAFAAGGDGAALRRHRKGGGRADVRCWLFGDGRLFLASGRSAIWTLARDPSLMIGAAVDAFGVMKMK